MESTNTLELYKTTKTTEGSQAQARIVQDLFEGRGLKVDTAQTQLEGYYRAFLVQHSGVAYQEIVDVVDLDPHKLSPIKEAEIVRLDDEDKNKLTNYLLKKNHGWIKKLAGGADDSDTVKIMLAFAEIAHRVAPDEYDAEIVGPVIRMSFKSVDAYSRFADSLNSAGSSGLFFPLPLGEDSEGKRINSSNTFINLVSPNEAIGTAVSVDQHEKYHAVDYFRQEQLKKIAADNPKNSSIRTVFPEADRFQERLKSFFFDPEVFVKALEDLRTQAPEIYGYFCGLGVIGRLKNFPFLKKAFISSFSSIQREVPAFIAGYLSPKNNAPFTDSQRNEIIRRLLRFYMPFGKVKVDELEARSARNEEGRLVMDEVKVDEDMQKQAQEKEEEGERTEKILKLSLKINDPVEGDAASDEMDKLFPNGEEQRQIEMLNHYEGNKDLYTHDVQRAIDFFLNEGGQGYETIEQIRKNLTDAMDAYRHLAALRNNPYQALVEISLIPLSHWVTYSNRQRDMSIRESTSPHS